MNLGVKFLTKYKAGIFLSQINLFTMRIIKPILIHIFPAHMYFADNNANTKIYDQYQNPDLHCLDTRFKKGEIIIKKVPKV